MEDRQWLAQFRHTVFVTLVEKMKFNATQQTRH